MIRGGGSPPLRASRLQPTGALITSSDVLPGSPSGVGSREWAVSSPKPGCKWKGEQRRLWRGWLFYERDRPKNSPRASLKFQLTALEDALTAEDGDREMSSELQMKLDIAHVGWLEIWERFL